MESNRQKKRTKIEVTRNPDQFKRPSVMKSAKLSGFGHSRVTETLSTPPLEQSKIPCKRIKLQLFPLDDLTKLGLEKDGYNPYLELTLSARKKVPSIVRHLHSKWSCSNVAAKGQLVLFPYDSKPEQVTSCRRWTSNDEVVTAWDVYVSVGSPPIFRLRYGWFSNDLQKAYGIPLKSNQLDLCYSSEVLRTACTEVLEMPNHLNGSESIEKHANSHNGVSSNINEMWGVNDNPVLHVECEVRTDITAAPTSIIPWDDSFTNLSIGGILSELSQQKKINESDGNTINNLAVQPIELSSAHEPLQEQPILLFPSDISVGGLFSEASLLSSKKNMEEQKKEVDTTRIQCLWDASSLSTGGLLSESALELKAEETNVDSFDALLQNHLKSHYQTPNASILDAEETCHAFPLHKFHQSTQ